MRCKYCDAPEDQIVQDSRGGIRYCSQCGHVLSKIIDEELEARKFVDSAATMARDRTGTVVNRNMVEDKAEQAAYYVCQHCRLPQDLGMRGLSLFYEYRAATEVVKSMRSRNMETVMAGCIYLEQQIELNKRLNRDIKTECHELIKIRNTLSEFCIGKGRGKNPFDSQMKDLEIYLNLDAFVSVDACITEIRKRMANWPDEAIKCVKQAKIQLQDIEEQKCKEITVFKYTCLLYSLLCIRGYKPEDFDRIVKIAVADKEWLRGLAEEIYRSRKLILDQIFDPLINQ